MLKRGYLQISFGWLFAIIVGVIILFLTIYGVTRLTQVGQYETSTVTQKEIEVLLNPLETGFESGRTTSFSLPRETRINNGCDDGGVFGRQLISLSQKSFGRWSEPTRGTSFKNKYIFSENASEGKTFIVFSKPFNFPFKVSDLIYLIPAGSDYCFVSANVEIEKEIDDLNLEIIQTVDSLEDCSEKSIKVCFESDSEFCDIVVDEIRGEIDKDDGTVYFDSDALMYAGIFSDRDVYECQINRLMKRTRQLAELYIDKSDLILKEGCETYLNSDLGELINYIENFEESEDIFDMLGLVGNIQRRNENALCRLW